MDARLARAAADFAAYMAESGRYGHAADGREPAARVQAAGYRWCRVAENIGWLYDSRGYDAAGLAQGFAEGWATSPPPRTNMLDGRLAETGVGVAQAGNGRWYGVQLFAARCPA